MADGEDDGVGEGMRLSFEHLMGDGTRNEQVSTKGVSNFGHFVLA